MDEDSGMVQCQIPGDSRRNAAFIAEKGLIATVKMPHTDCKMPMAWHQFQSVDGLIICWVRTIVDCCAFALCPCEILKVTIAYVVFYHISPIGCFVSLIPGIGIPSPSRLWISLLVQLQLLSWSYRSKEQSSRSHMIHKHHENHHLKSRLIMLNDGVAAPSILQPLAIYQVSMLSGKHYKYHVIVCAAGCPEQVRNTHLDT